MHLHRLDLNLLVALDHLLVEQSVTRAAERLSISQPATSGALVRLREHFGDDLLTRVGREMVLTPFGASLAPRVRSLVAQVAELAQARAGFEPATSDRAFTVVASDYALTVMLPRAIRLVMAEAPGIALQTQVRGPDHEDRFAKGQIDAFIVPRSMALEHHPMLPLFCDEYVVIACRDHPRVQASIDLEQYLSLRHAVRRADRVLGIETGEERQLARQGLQRNIAIAVPTFDMLPRVVVGTQLIAGMQRRLAQLAAATLPIQILEHPLQIAPLELVMQWPTHRDGDPGTAWLQSVFQRVAHARS